MATEFRVYDAGIGGKARASFPDTVDTWTDIELVRDVYRERAARLGRCFVVVDQTGRQVLLIGSPKN